MALGTVILALRLTLVASPVSAGPRVELVDPSGQLDGSGHGPSSPSRWDRVRIRVKVRNHLDVRIDDVRLNLSLLDGGTPIPGWTFQHLDAAVEVASQGTVTFLVRQELPPLRHAPPADAVAFRVELHSYRVSQPSLGLAFALLSSGAASDQRAALRSLAGAPPESIESRLRRELANELANLPRDAPTATDALQLLLAARAVGSMGLGSEVPSLLALPERLDREAWGRAVLDLASKMVLASGPDDPRLEVLPRWARQVSTLLLVTSRDALFEATRDAILSMGSRAVPALIRATGPDAPHGRRERAQRLLERLGRATPRAQALSGSVEDRVEAIRALGAIGKVEAVPALVECLSGSEKVARAARAALQRMGAVAVGPMAEMLGREGDGPTRALLVEQGRRHPRALAEVADLYRIRREGSTPSEVIRAVAERRAWERTVRLESEIRDAIALGAEGAYRAALDRLDSVRSEDPKVYRRHADPIARIYVARAEQLLERGDFQEAVVVLDAGWSIRPLPEIAMRLTDAQLALARGFTRLGLLGRAEKALEAAPLKQRSDVVEARLAWLNAQIDDALSRNALGEAGTLLERAHELADHPAELEALDRKMFIAKRWLELVVVFGLLLGATTIVVVSVYRRVERYHLEELTRALDNNSGW